MTQPWDFEQARTAARQAAELQQQAERIRADASEQAALTERVYRMALSKKIVELIAEGRAATVAQDLAKGDKQVADLRYERDVARGVLDVAEQRAWRHTADRKDVHEFIRWSQRLDCEGVEATEREPVRRAA